MLHEVPALGGQLARFQARARLAYDAAANKNNIGLVSLIIGKGGWSIFFKMRISQASPIKTRVVIAAISNPARDSE